MSEQKKQSKIDKKSSKKKSASRLNDDVGGHNSTTGDIPGETRGIDLKTYEKHLRRLQIELVKMQDWVHRTGERLLVIFEGRDAAGKGGVIKRVSERLNPRICRIVALGTPTDRETGQWYFQRYVEQLPARGEIVLMDRSWYNRAGVERVMGFCTDEEYKEFLISCPEFEKILVRSGLILIKYWFSISNAEQERRFQKRLKDPTKHWKLSPMDIKSRELWNEYSRAKDSMMAHTDSKHAPWYIVEGDSKRRARLNCISHLLNTVDWQELEPLTPFDLPPRPEGMPIGRTPKSERNIVPEVF